MSLKGRGGGRGRGGRGTGGNKIHIGHYQDDAWSALTEDEQTQVYALRDKVRREVSAANGKRSQDEISHAPEASTALVTVPAAAGNAGSQISQRQKNN